MSRDIARDVQKSKIYSAEMVLLDKGIGVTPRFGRAFGDIEEVQAYVDHLLGSVWWQRRSTVRTVRVGNGAGKRNALSYGGRIEIPRWARTEGVVLHEMAHELSNHPTAWAMPDDTITRWQDNQDCSTSSRYAKRYTGYAGHGRWFAHCFLDLVGYKISKDAKIVLRDSFKKHGARYTKRRTPMTPEQKEMAMANIRKFQKKGTQ